MEKTDQAVLTLIRAALWSEPLELSPDLDWDTVEQELRLQSVMGVVAGAHLDGLPDAVRDRWDYAALRCGAHFYKLLHAQDELLGLLQENGIPAVILKGTAAAVYYPDPEMRTMGDVDILVPMGQTETAASLLSANGYVREESLYEPHISFDKDGIRFELHRYLGNLDSASKMEFLNCALQEGIRRKIDQVCAGSVSPMLPPLENGLVLLDHMGKHIRQNGIGVRHVMDWMMYAYHCLTDDYWHGQFAPAARVLGLETFAITITQMCRIYLGLPDSITWCGGADAALCRRLLEAILGQGNFGCKHMQKQGVTSVKIRSLFYRPKNFWGRLKLSCKLLQSSGLAHWQAAERYKFLRSFAWIYGGCRYLFMKLRREKTISLRSVWESTHANRQLFEALDILPASTVVRIENNHFAEQAPGRYESR